MALAACLCIDPRQIRSRKLNACFGDAEITTATAKLRRASRCADPYGVVTLTRAGHVDGQLRTIIMGSMNLNFLIIDTCDRDPFVGLVADLEESVRKWISAIDARTAFIEPGSPWENGCCESLIARLRDELLEGEIF